MVIFWGPGSGCSITSMPTCPCWAPSMPVAGPACGAYLGRYLADHRADAHRRAAHWEVHLLRGAVADRAAGGLPGRGVFSVLLQPDRGRGPDVGGCSARVAQTTTRVLAARRRMHTAPAGRAAGGRVGHRREACQAALAVVGRSGRRPVHAGLPAGARQRDITLAGHRPASPATAVATFTTAPVLHQAVSGALSTQAPRELTDPRLLAAAAIADRPGLIGGMPPAKTLILPFGVAGAGPPAGVLCCGVSPYCVLDDDYRAFFELAALQLGTLVADVRSWEAERIRAAQLAELDQAKTVFFSNVSHEFRTPLTLILVPVEELRMAPAGTVGAAAQEDLEVIHRNAAAALQAGQYAAGLLPYRGRPVAGRFEPVDLAAVHRRPGQRLPGRLERAGLAFEVDCPPLGEPVYVDHDMWEKVVAEPAQQRAEVHLRRDRSGCPCGASRRRAGRCCRSRTPAPASPDPDMPHLFERFHRVYHAAGPARTRAAASAWPWSRSWPGCTAASITADSVAGWRQHIHRVGSRWAVRTCRPTSCAPGPPPSGPPSDAAPYVPRGSCAGCRRVPRRPSPAGLTSRPPGCPAEPVLIADDNADMREYLRRLLPPATR